MWVLPALAGALIALGIREWVEWLERRAEKIKNCSHIFYETTYAGYTTEHCKRCPYQRPREPNELKEDEHV